MKDKLFEIQKDYDNGKISYQVFRDKCLQVIVAMILKEDFESIISGILEN